MNSYRKLAVISCLFTATLLGREPGWKEEKLERIESSGSLPVQERIPILGQLVRIGNIENTGGRIGPDQQEVFNATQSALLAIPGHAEYYRDKINAGWDAYEKLLEGERESGISNPEKGEIMYHLRNDMMYGAASLGQLPSPETVRVLSEMLMDDRFYPKDDLKARAAAIQYMPPPSSCALTALYQLPLASRPTSRIGNLPVFELDAPAWRLWCSQVKAGTRTFRFEGDPQEYSLNGPVGTASAVVKRERRAAEPTAPPTTPARASHSRWPLIATLGASAVLAGGVWRLFRSRRQV